MSIICKTNTKFENEYVRVEYLTDLKCVEVSWKAYADEVQIEEIFYRSTGMLTFNEGASILFDNNKFEGATPELIQWVQDVYYEMAYKSGVKNIAIVFSPDVFGQFSIEAAVNAEARAKMNTELFGSVDNAKKWLAKFL